MQNINVLDQNYENGQIELSNQAIDYIRESAKWGTFLSIVGFIFIGLLVIIALFVGVFFSAMGSDIPGTEDLAMMGPLLTVFYLILAGLYLYPTLKLYQFSNKAKKAIANNNSVTMTESLGNLKSMFKFMGIMTIVILGLYALLILFGIIGGAIGMATM